MSMNYKKSAETSGMQASAQKAMKASKSYGYEWVSVEFDDELSINEFKKQMSEDGLCSVCIMDGEEPHYALGEDLYEEMEGEKEFSESDVYRWINQGRIDCWSEILGRKVGYFCDGYCSYVFDPKMTDVNSLKNGRWYCDVVYEEC